MGPWKDVNIYWNVSGADRISALSTVGGNASMDRGTKHLVIPSVENVYSEVLRKYCKLPRSWQGSNPGEIPNSAADHVCNPI